MISFRNESTSEESVWSTNSSRVLHQEETAQDSESCVRILTRKGFRISLAGFQDFFLSIIRHFTKEKEILFESCILKNVQESTSDLERRSCRTNIILSSVTSKFVHYGAYVTRGNYDDSHGSIRDNNQIRNVLVNVSETSSFGSTRLLRFSEVLVRGDDSPY